MDRIDLMLLIVLVVLIILYFTTKPKQKSPEELAEIEKQGGDISEGEQVVSFLIPLVGFIIYSVNSSERPYKAKKALMAAIWGVVMGVCLVLFSSMLLLQR